MTKFPKFDSKPIDVPKNHYTPKDLIYALREGKTSEIIGKIDRHGLYFEKEKDGKRVPFYLTTVPGGIMTDVQIDTVVDLASEIYDGDEEEIEAELRREYGGRKLESKTMFVHRVDTGEPVGMSYYEVKTLEDDKFKDLNGKKILRLRSIGARKPFRDGALGVLNGLAFMEDYDSSVVVTGIPRVVELITTGFPNFYNPVFSERLDQFKGRLAKKIAKNYGLDFGEGMVVKGKGDIFHLRQRARDDPCGDSVINTAIEDYLGEKDRFMFLGGNTLSNSRFAAAQLQFYFDRKGFEKFVNGNLPQNIKEYFSKPM
jgi:hypothetical protein